MFAEADPRYVAGGGSSRASLLGYPGGWIPGAKVLGPEEVTS